MGEVVQFPGANENSPADRTDEIMYVRDRLVQRLPELARADQAELAEVDVERLRSLGGDVMARLEELHEPKSE